MNAKGEPARAVRTLRPLLEPKLLASVNDWRGDRDADG
jgi:hypothetical protein